MADELAILEDEYRGLYLEVTEVKLLADMNLDFSMQIFPHLL